MISFLISILIALGVYFLGKFIGKRFTNFHEFSYLGFAIISFMLAFICHEKVQNAILKIFVNYPFVDHQTIILFVIALSLMAILFIFFLEDRRKLASDKSINVSPLLNITALEKWALRISDEYNYIKRIVLYAAPFSSLGLILSTHKKYVLFFDFDTSTVKGQNSKGTFNGHTWFTKRAGKNYPIDDSFKEVYNQDPSDEFFKEWLIATEKPKGINERLSKILYDKKST